MKGRVIGSTSPFLILICPHERDVHITPNKIISLPKALDFSVTINHIFLLDDYEN